MESVDTVETSHSPSSTVTVTATRTSTFIENPSSEEYGPSTSTSTSTITENLGSGVSAASSLPTDPYTNVPGPYISKSVWSSYMSGVLSNTSKTSAPAVTLNPLPKKQTLTETRSSTKGMPPKISHESEHAGKHHQAHSSEDCESSTHGAAPTTGPHPDKLKMPHMITSVDELEDALDKLGHKAVVLFAPIIKEVGSIQVSAEGDVFGGLLDDDPNKIPAKGPARHHGHTVTKTVTDCDCLGTEIPNKGHHQGGHGSRPLKSSSSSLYYTTTMKISSSVTSDSMTTFTTVETHRGPPPNTVITGSTERSVTYYEPVPVTSTHSRGGRRGSKTVSLEHTEETATASRQEKPLRPSLASAQHQADS